MAFMFENCTSLISLDLSNFYTYDVVAFNHMFYNCINLEYLNIINFFSLQFDQDSEYIQYNQYIFENVTDSLVYCLDLKNHSYLFISQLTSKKCSTNYCLNDWKSKKKKEITINQWKI